MKTNTDQEVVEKVREGFRRVGLTLPYLAGLIQTIRVQVDRRIETSFTLRRLGDQQPSVRADARAPVANGLRHFGPALARRLVEPRQ